MNFDKVTVEKIVDIRLEGEYKASFSDGPPCIDDFLESEQEMTDINFQNLQSILTLILNTFSLKVNSLNCFMTIGAGENRTCFHYLHSLPMMKLSAFNDSNKNTNICFSSDWNGDRKIYKGWDVIPENEMESIRNRNRHFYNYKAQSVLIIPNVQKIRIYKWGFEILNSGNIELTAVLSYAILSHPTTHLSEKPWKIPLSSSILSDITNTKPVAAWDNKSSNTEIENNEKGN